MKERLIAWVALVCFIIEMGLMVYMAMTRSFIVLVIIAFLMMILCCAGLAVVDRISRGKNE